MSAPRLHDADGHTRLKIGVFDSGVGGLTVLRALIPRLPAADYLYLGDTARLPYGSKSRETIARYAVSSVRFLMEQGAEFLVIACNTASALALDAIQAAAAPLPVIGVIETGANAAREATHSGDVLVIATQATVQSHAYAAACRERGLRALEKGCPLLVPLVEEGWIDHPVTAEVVRIYLSELLQRAKEDHLRPDTLVLGCTHYPLLREVIERRLKEHSPHPPIRVIDSAEATAAQVARRLEEEAARPAEDRSGPGERSPHASAGQPSCRFFATDSVEKFRALGSRFLGQGYLGPDAGQVEHVELGG